MVADALRSTLDSLQLDPSVQKDRHYLITMLRRLGYTEVEIRQALGEIEEPVVETEVTTVELEYSEEEEELDLQDFEPVIPARDGGFVVHTEPEEVVFEDVTEEDAAEFEILENQVLKFEEIAPPAPGKRTRLRVVRADSPEAAADIARSQGHDVVHTVPVNVRQTGGAPQDEWAQPEETNGFAADDESWEWHGDDAQEPAQTWDEESSWEEVPEPEPMQEVAETEVWEDEAWAADPEPVADAEPEAAWEAEPVEEIPELAEAEPMPADEWQIAAEPEEAVWEAEATTDTIAWDAPEPAAEAPEVSLEADDFEGEPVEEVDSSADYYSRNEYVLHMRKAKLPSGKTETLYFFAKGVSESGSPIPLPEGYVVREHPGSKLPYITRDDA